MIFHHNLWPRVPQRVCRNSDTSNEAHVAKNSDGKSYTHTPAVHGKSHSNFELKTS